MHRKPLVFACLVLAAGAVAFGGPAERLLAGLCLGLPAAFFLPLSAALWIAHRLTRQAKYRP